MVHLRLTAAFFRERPMDKVKRRKLDSFEKTSTPLCPELNGLYFASKH
jgi:hypothetical protein